MTGSAYDASEEHGRARTDFARLELLHHLEAFLEPLLASLTPFVSEILPPNIVYGLTTNGVHMLRSSAVVLYYVLYQGSQL